MHLWVTGNWNLEQNIFVEFRCYITEHKRLQIIVKTKQNISKQYAKSPTF